MKRRMAVIRAAACITVASMTLGVNTTWAQSSQVMPRLILKWKGQPSATVISDAQARYGVTLRSLRTLPTGGQVMQANRTMTSTDLQNLITDLSKSSAIAYVHADTMLKRQITPNDTRLNEQWNLLEVAGGINLLRAWDLSTGAGVRVAVLDTGYRPNPDLTPNIVGGYDFISDPFIANDGGGRDSNAMDPGDAAAAGVCGPNTPATNSTWHGTNIAGTIAAVANNGIGVAGVAFGAKVVPIRVVGRCGALLSDVAEGAIWAAGGSIPGVPANPNPAKVINISLSAPAACDPTSQGVINIIRSLGAVVVTSAGNDNVDAKNYLPASCDGVITVAATTRQGGKASYSNFGEVVDMAAPGGDARAVKANGVLSLINFGTSAPGSDGYDYAQGTSTATAEVSGVAALMLARAPNLLPDQVESLLKSTARRFPVACDSCGEGIVDAFKAVDTTINLPRAVAFIRGGAFDLKLAGTAPTVTAEQFDFAVEYKLTRKSALSTVVREIRQSTPVFKLPVMGCLGETVNFTLTVTDVLGRTDSYSQVMTFIFNPSGASVPCGR